MADATFNDILKQQKITNSLLEQEAMDEGKPNPKKFIKEEALSILLERKYAKSSLGLAKKSNKIAAANEKVNTKSGQEDRKIYEEQLEKQALLVADQTETVKALDDVGFNAIEFHEEQVRSGHYGTQNAILENARIVENAIVGLKFQNIKAANDDKLERQKERVQSNLDGRRNVTDVIKKTRDALLPTLNRIGSVLMAGPRALGRGVRKQAGNALDFLKNIFGKILGAGLLVGMVTFFSSQAFKRIVEWFQGDGLEIIANFYDKVFEPAIVKGFAMLKDIFTAIGNYFSKPEFKEAFRLIKEGKIFDALGLALRTITDDLGKQFGIENLSEKVGTALVEFYNAIAKRLNYMISTLNIFGTDIPKLPIIDLETGKFETPEVAAGRERLRKLREDPLTKKAFESATIEAATGDSTKLRVLTELAQRPADDMGFTTSPRDILKAAEAIDTARASLKEIIGDRDKINEMLGSNLAATIAAQERGQIGLVNALEKRSKELRVIQEEAAKEVVAATNQFNSATTVAPVDQSITVAGSGSGSMRPSSEVVDKLTMAF